jgi:16S rRNA (guanine527-N7)-methyltransferase
MMTAVSRETRDKLERYVELLIDENGRQNLVAKSTEPHIWARHIEDSLQLIDFAPNARKWVDIGSGAGLPGMVIAITTGRPVTLVEPRALRVQFLNHVQSVLGLTNVSIVQGKARAASGAFDAITARAVASAPDLLAMTLHLSHPGTRWVLSKGRSVQKELEAVESTWQGSFRVEPSRTDPEAGILIAQQVRPRGGR